jgi:hypothetical protein
MRTQPRRRLLVVDEAELPLTELEVSVLKHALQHADGHIDEMVTALNARGGRQGGRHRLGVGSVRHILHNFLRYLLMGTIKDYPGVAQWRQENGGRNLAAQEQPGTDEWDREAERRGAEREQPLDHAAEARKMIG